MGRVAILLWAVLISEGFGLITLLTRKKELVREWGYGKPAPALAYVLGGLVAVIYCFVSISSSPVILAWVARPSPLKLIGIMAALAAGFLEEILFRGAIMTALKNRGWNVGFQVLVSSSAFGLAHAVWGLPSGHFVGPMVATGALGCACAFLYLASNRSLGPVIACHVLVDSVLEPGLLISALHLAH